MQAKILGAALIGSLAETYLIVIRSISELGDSYTIVYIAKIILYTLEEVL